MTNYNDGRIHGWNGGECPVHPETEFEAWLRGGERDTDMARVFVGWQHDNEDHYESGDIIAFRVVKEHREPKTIWVNEYGEDNRGVAYYSKEEAKDHAKGCTRIAVKYQEMIE